MAQVCIHTRFDSGVDLLLTISTALQYNGNLGLLPLANLIGDGGDAQESRIEISQLDDFLRLYKRLFNSSLQNTTASTWMTYVC